MNTNELPTTSTDVSDLVCGDVVYHRDGDRIVLSAITDDEFGTWVTWKSGGRDSYPLGYKVYVVG